MPLCMFLHLILFLNLSIISISAMLPKKMLVLNDLGCRSYARHQKLCAAGHLRHFLKNNCIVNRIIRISSPGKGTMIVAEHAGNVHRILSLESLNDH